MKLKITLIIPAFFMVFLFFQGKKIERRATISIKADTVLEFSADAKAIIDQKCYGCHNTKSKNPKPRKKINWDSLAFLSVPKKVAKLDDIMEVLEKGEMPPKKFLETKPEGKLTPEEVSILKAWAEKSSDRLMK